MGYYSSIVKALEELNWNRGRGIIESVDFSAKKVRVRLQYGHAHFSYRVKAGRVFARGSSRALSSGWGERAALEKAGVRV